MKRKFNDEEEKDQKKRKIMSLEILLNETSPSMNTSNSVDYFSQIASKIFFDSILYINKKTPVRIIEIEFYFHSKAHPDFFTHRHKKQLTKCEWYFHQMSSKEFSYKSGTYKGFDFTFGDEKDNIFGGVLIRGIEILFPEKKFIFGPCKVVNYILERSSSGKIKELVVSKLKNDLRIFGNDFKMKFKDKKDSMVNHVSKFQWNNIHFCTSSRVGLTLKNQTNIKERIDFILKPYRYFIFPHSLKKGKINYICSLFRDHKGKNVQKIQQEMKIQEKTIHRYYEDYVLGEKTEKVDTFVGKKFNNSLLLQLHGFIYKKQE